MPCSRNSHMIPTLRQWLHDLDIDPNINLDIFFPFNQTFIIFYPKILYALFLAFSFFCHQAAQCCYFYLSCTNSDITYPCINLDIIFYISALVFSKNKVLRILHSRGQAACLMASLQKKTTYKSAFFLLSGGKTRDIL